MHFTFHLTSGCDLRCGYCYAPPSGRKDMTSEVLSRAVDFADTTGNANIGIIFFGGEPLLCKDLIRECIALCRQREKRSGNLFHFKVTTNGLGLDEDFLQYASQERMIVALSLDGPPEVHDRHRRDRAGKGSSSQAVHAAELLLNIQPYAYALMTVTPETVHRYCDSFEYLLGLGFRYILASLNYAGNWQPEHLPVLKDQLKRVAARYERETLEGRKFYLSPFEKKIASHIRGGENICKQCHFGVKQISVAPDGTLYPCIQFVQDGDRGREFAMGDVWNGIDAARQSALFIRSRAESLDCASCALKERCEHRCSCLNWQTSGAIDRVAPILCETERILIPIADRLGDRLWRKKAPLFIQKHYNPNYPLISWMEDHL